MSTNHNATNSVALTRNEDFKSPHTMRNKLGRIGWVAVFNLLYRWTPARFGMRWRRFLLRLFGAKIGRSWIHPTVEIWAPWLLVIGDDSYIDKDCYLYNTFGIEVGDRVIVSFGTVLCTPSHDYNEPTYPLIGSKIVLENDSWIMAQAFICPGVTIGCGAVVAARSVVTKVVPNLTVVGGNPARFIKSRNLGT